MMPVKLNLSVNFERGILAKVMGASRPTICLAARGEDEER